MKAYRIVTYVIDHEEIGRQELLYHVTDCKYLQINTGAIDEIDIGEWDDDHPLNSYETDTEAYFQERLNDKHING